MRPGAVRVFGVKGWRRVVPVVLGGAAVGGFLVAAAASGPADASRTLGGLDHIALGEQYRAGDLVWNVIGVQPNPPEWVDYPIVEVQVTNLGEVPLSTVGIGSDDGEDLLPLSAWTLSDEPASFRRPVRYIRSEDDGVGTPQLNPRVPTVLELHIDPETSEPLTGENIRLFLTSTTVERTVSEAAGFRWSEPETAAYVDLEVP